MWVFWVFLPLSTPVCTRMAHEPEHRTLIKSR